MMLIAGLAGENNEMPTPEDADLNIENYILSKTLKGLFTLVAKEEKNSTKPSGKSDSAITKSFCWYLIFLSFILKDS